MPRPLASLALVTLLATVCGCHASSIQAGRDSLGLVTLIIVGGALLVALLGYLYGYKGGSKDDK